MRSLSFLLLAGCAGLPEPTPEALRELRMRLPEPPKPFARVRATVDVDGTSFAGSFQALLVAKTGPDPVVRLQLLPDVGGKVLDLVARRDRITGWFPPTGEKVDVALPAEARPHPIVFFGLTLLERFSPLEDRIRGAERVKDEWHFEIRPVSDAVEVAGRVEHGFLATNEPIANRIRLNFRGPWGASWTWSAPSETIDAPGFRLHVRSWAEERLDRVDEALFRLELPVDSR